MKCEEVLSRLWEYLDQELAPEEANAVRAHLSSCGCCHPAYCCDRAFLELLARQRGRGSAPPTLAMWVRRWRRAVLMP
jgi:mycothiol system anti-sigma-R factor